MENNEESEQSFLRMFYAPSWPDLEKILYVWRSHLLEPNQSAMYMAWDNLVFVFDDVFNKQKVYRDLAHMIAFGWFKEKQIAQISRYMAKHSNLNDNEDMHIRENNIRHGIYGQMNFYQEQRAKTKKNGTIIITTQQGRLSEKCIYRAGSGVNSYW